MSGSCAPLFFSSWSRLRLQDWRNLGLAQRTQSLRTWASPPLPTARTVAVLAVKTTQQNSNILPYQTFKLGFDYSTTPKISTSRFVFALGKYVLWTFNSNVKCVKWFVTIKLLYLTTFISIFLHWWTHKDWFAQTTFILIIPKRFETLFSCYTHSSFIT